VIEVDTKRSSILAANNERPGRLRHKGEALENLAHVIPNVLRPDNIPNKPPFLRMLSARSVGLKTIPDVEKAIGIA